MLGEAFFDSHMEEYAVEDIQLVASSRRLHDEVLEAQGKTKKNKGSRRLPDPNLNIV